MRRLTQSDDAPVNIGSQNLASADANNAASTSQSTRKPGIVWIASYPKSGNTWTRAFLHNIIREMSGEDGAQDINAMGRFSTLEILKANYQRVLGFVPSERDGDQVAAARMQVQRNIADSADGIVFVKTHHALAINRSAPTINLAVTSGAIYIVRNPLDVAISFAAHSAISIDDIITAMNEPELESLPGETTVFEAVGSWSQNVESWTRNDHPSIHVMRYEDMLSEPETTFAALARHLLFDPTQAQLERAIRNSSFTELQGQERQKSFAEKPAAASSRFFREGRADQWKDVLDRRQVRRIENAHHRQMARFGYLG
jgi:hypothetical protein